MYHQRYGRERTLLKYVSSIVQYMYMSENFSETVV